MAKKKKRTVSKTVTSSPPSKGGKPTRRKSTAKTTAKKKPWLTSTGEVRAEMRKFLTKKGTIRKNVSLPPGVRSVKRLWEYIQAGKVKSPKGKGVTSFTVTSTFWEFMDMMDRDFEKFRFVSMGGKKISRTEWDESGADYLQEIKGTSAKEKEYEITYLIVSKDNFQMIFV